MSHWIYKNKKVTGLEDLPSDCFGFVYMITNDITKQRYIGRKQFGTRRRKPLTKAQKAAGRKRRQIVYKESDWKLYTSSSLEVNKDIKELGKDNFTFEILLCAKTKGQCNYLEENLQHKMNVLLDPLFYNDSIGSRKFIGVKLTPEFINEVLELKL